MNSKIWSRARIGIGTVAVALIGLATASGAMSFAEWHASKDAMAADTITSGPFSLKQECPDGICARIEADIDGQVVATDEQSPGDPNAVDPVCGQGTSERFTEKLDIDIDAHDPDVSNMTAYAGVFLNDRLRIGSVVGYHQVDLLDPDGNSLGAKDTNDLTEITKAPGYNSQTGALDVLSNYPVSWKIPGPGTYTVQWTFNTDCDPWYPAATQIDLPTRTWELVQER